MKNIISIVRDFIELWWSGNLRALMLCSKNPFALESLRDLNDATEKLEKLGRKKFGPDYKLHRYRLIDFFI